MNGEYPDDDSDIMDILIPQHIKYRDFDVFAPREKQSREALSTSLPRTGATTLKKIAMSK